MKKLKMKEEYTWMKPSKVSNRSIVIVGMKMIQTARRPPRMKTWYPGTTTASPDDRLRLQKEFISRCFHH
ncbi:MAG: hypothetical protein ABH891_00045 [Candidatus Omnitrophota bacterium]